MPRGLAIGVACVAVACGAQPASADAQKRDAPQRYAPGEALVRFEPGVMAAERRAARDNADVGFDESLRLPRTQLVSFDGSVQAAIERLENQPGVAYAQPNYRYRATAAAPDDDFFDQQWGLGSAPGVGVLSGWDRSRGAGQLIAVLDTGVDLTHPDLAPNVVPGRDFVSGDSNPDDYQYHGSHVAGIAAGVAGNGSGIAGVAPDAKLMPVRVLDGDGVGSTAGIAEGIEWAATSGADVINMSLGGPTGVQDHLYNDAVAFADSSDTVVVVAAGNASDNNDTEPTMPCSIPAPNLLCVAALRSDGTLAGYSNFGETSVDLAAPGSAVLSAKTDWGAPVSGPETFESGAGAWTTSWGVVDSSNGTKAATDSPSGNYAPDTVTALVKSAPVDLTGQRGCRMHFDVRRQLALAEDGAGHRDFLFAGADTSVPGLSDGDSWLDSTGADFSDEEVSLSDVDGRSDVKPTFELWANADASVADGAYVDNVRVLCRDATYTDAVVPDTGDYAAPTSGSYMRLNGTSMASPHVAGIAALVRAADPGAPDTQVVEAIKQGAVADARLTGLTATGGRADAVRAIDAALGAPNPPPGSGSATTSPTTSTGTTGTNETTPTDPLRPGPARFAGRARVDRRGRLSIRIFGEPQLAGRLTLRSHGRLVARRVSFRLGPRGRALVTLRLNDRGRRLIRRRGRLPVRASVRLRNAAGLSSTTLAVIALRRR